jgi:hypothetical protein
MYQKRGRDYSIFELLDNFNYRTHEIIFHVLNFVLFSVLGDVGLVGRGEKPEEVRCHRTEDRQNGRPVRGALKAEQR